MSSPAPTPTPAPASVDQTETQNSFVMDVGGTAVALVKSVVYAMLDQSTAARSDAHTDVHSEAFQDCLNSQEFDDMGKCQYYVDMLVDCCRKTTC